MKSHSKIGVIIPAFNECAGIRSILRDLKLSQMPARCELRDIVVVSDASEDGTDEIVNELADHDSRIRLLRTAKRAGKNACLSIAFNKFDADIYVVLDADVRLADERTVAHMLLPIISEGCQLVGCAVTPVKTRRFSIAQMARAFDFIIESHCRMIKPTSYYSCYGRAMALTRECVAVLDLPLPTNHADDLYIYYSVRKRNLGFHYAANAQVLFAAATTLRGYADQYTRFWHYKTNAAALFGKSAIDSDLAVPAIKGCTLRAMLVHPTLATSWLVARLFLLSRLGSADRGWYDTGLYYTESAPVPTEALQFKCHGGRK